MKLIERVLLAVFALTVAGCSKTPGPDPIEILPVDGATIQASQIPEETVYLNLTSIGLYDGKAGKAIPDSNIEFGHILTSVKSGDALPNKSVITSSSVDVTFKTWCYYKGDGILTYTTKIVDEVSIYQAVFEYHGNYEFKPTTPKPTSTVVVPPTSSSPVSSPDEPPVSSSSSSSSSSTVEDGNVVRFYFVDQSWWNKDAAESWIYIWNSAVENSYKLAYPGEIMTHVKYDETTGMNLWYSDIDLSLYNMAVISRCSGDGLGTDWGAKTGDITLDKSFNTIILGSEKWGTADYTTDMVTY